MSEAAGAISDAANASVLRELLNTGAVGAILAIILWFFITKVWPWYTGVYWPARREQEDRRIETMNSLTENVAVLKSLIESESNERHSMISLLASISASQERVLTEAANTNRLLQYIAEVFGRNDVDGVTRPHRLSLTELEVIATNSPYAAVYKDLIQGRKTAEEIATTLLEIGRRSRGGPLDDPVDAPDPP
jgi:hypothetical protein